MAEIGRTISNSVHKVLVDQDPRTSGVNAPLGSYAELTLDSTLFIKTSNTITGWESTAEYGSKVVSLGAGTVIDWSQGDIFEANLSANATFSFSNEPFSKTILLTINNTSASPINITLPPSLLWADGTPILEIPANTSGVFTLIKKDTQIFANALVGLS